MVVHGLSLRWIEILEGLSLLLMGPGMVCWRASHPAVAELSYITKYYCAAKVSMAVILKKKRKK
jgi:hypothetical protein